MAAGLAFERGRLVLVEAQGTLPDRGMPERRSREGRAERKVPGATPTTIASCRVVDLRNRRIDRGGEHGAGGDEGGEAVELPADPEDDRDLRQAEDRLGRPG